jgi:hypothetical protein
VVFSNISENNVSSALVLVNSNLLRYFINGNHTQ